MKKPIFSFILIVGFSLNILAQQDPYMWLEEVDGAKALEFVNKQNKATYDKLSGMKEYQEIYDKSLEIYNSSERIAYPTIYGAYIYNFWQDKEHERGIWRRTTKQNYTSGNPVWETLIDLDAMSAKDNVKWVFKGASGLYPDYNLFLVNLSKGGGDAVEIREFDVSKKAFVENGFIIEEAKGGADFIDKNTLIVSSDFGPNTMTSSGYPLQVKIWKRGTALKDAQLIHTGKVTDVGSWGYVMRDGKINYTGIHRAISTFETAKLIWINDQLVKLDIPLDADVSSLLNNQLIVSLRSDWKTGDITYKQGSLVSLNFTDLIKGKKNVKLIVEPDIYSSIEGISSTKNKLLIEMLSNVKSQLYIYSFNGGNWSRQRVAAPDFGSISISANDDLADDYYFSFTNFLTPSTLYAANAGDNTLRIAKSLPAFFDGTKYEVKQYKSKSKDGEMIPYFVVSSKTMKYDSKNPTLLYAYGGFEISETPGYSGVTGKAWLDNGGVYVLANIRGGGEFGPKWHQAGLKEKRQNIYNDFHAVAEDLITQKISSAKNLGILGGSNGGLLVGVAFTQRPELYNAVVCAVPLLDMQRYNKLLAGASWMGEYGDPDKPEEWEYISKYSPYHNLKPGTKYPEVFFYTSTRDDRVHPGHARKMAAKMIDMGNTVYYYENTEGGHGGSSTNDQRAKAAALQYTYLLMKLRDGN